MTPPETHPGSAVPAPRRGGLTAAVAVTAAVGFTVLVLAAGAGTPVAQPSRQRAVALVGREPIRPVPLQVDVDDRKVALGQRLFHDKRLSADDTISCASCHALDKGGVDGLPRSIGINGSESDLNAPTVFNSGFNFRQFWDGRAHTLEEQAGGPILAQREMGATWEQVIAKLQSSDDYAREFATVYGNGISPENIRDAIAEFERSLITPNCPLDRFLRGEEGALTSDEKKGYLAFKRYGCSSCHQGVNVGGNMFEAIGAVNEYFSGPTAHRKADLGRFNVTGREEDRHVFKVPSLRNVELTAPYFHDGSVATMEDAVRIMAKHQLGRSIPEPDVELIVLFLKTLTGVYTPRRP